MVPTPIRVLQVIGATDRGGAETWLVHALRHVDRRDVAMDFLVHDNKPGAYDADIVRQGAKIFPCGGHRNLMRQLRYLLHLQRSYGPYEVVHSHVDYYGGIVCLLARIVGVRARVVHSHNDTRVVDRSARLPRRLYTGSMKLFVRWFSTAGLGTSESAAALMFGDGWAKDSRWRVLPACVDFFAFRQQVDRSQVRAQLGIPDDAIVFGHVGRFVHQKNHDFLVKVAERLLAKERRAMFVLVGAGPTKEAVERQISQCGISDRFIILDPRDDIHRLMLGAFDFFLFPSLYEGLGLVLLEAQAAGLRCFASTGLPPEGVVVPGLVHNVPLAAGPDEWADRLFRQMGSPSPVKPDEALSLVERAFDIQTSAARLTEFYHEVASS